MIELDLYTSMPYAGGDVIAEIVSLLRYESQVAALMDEEERVEMEFFIACDPEVHPVIPEQAASARPVGAAVVKAKAAASV